jgi:hypothetical protein
MWDFFSCPDKRNGVFVLTSDTKKPTGLIISEAFKIRFKNSIE